MSQPKVVIKNLSKVFYHSILDTVREGPYDKSRLSPDDKLVLDNLSLEFNSGETIGLVGRNGAGKSTLLSILAGISKQSHGEVLINGKVTAVMTLGLGLREDLTGRANIYLDGELQGKTRAEIDRIIDEIIQFAELDDFIDKPVKIYSTGMKSRLAFSMLVEIEPEILIIDEALSAGDAFFAEKASQKIKQICQKGKIVILVSHSMATIESMCNRCIWLEKGLIIMDGNPADVTQHYLQKIRDEDRQKGLQFDQKQMIQTTAEAKYKIIDVKMTRKDSDYQQAVFYTHESFAIAIEISGEQRTGEMEINLSIERFDGLVVCNVRHPELARDLPTLVFSLDSLVLNQGYYQAKIELIENGITTNQTTRFFEVKNDNMAKGGWSILDYPAEIIVNHEEVNQCSDSIELITG